MRSPKTKTATTTKPATTKTTKHTAKAPPSLAFARMALSEPWMSEWADDVLSTGSIEAACANARLSLADFADARKRDSVFDGLCRELDQIADLRISDTIRTKTINGDIRSQTLYYARVRDLILPAAAAPSSAALLLSATITEAMIRAGLIAAEAAKSAPPAGPPALPSGSRPRPPRSHQPDDGP